MGKWQETKCRGTCKFSKMYSQEHLEEQGWSLYRCNYQPLPFFVTHGSGCSNGMLFAVDGSSCPCYEPKEATK